MNVFDEEAAVDTKEARELCFMYAQAGLTLDETRTLAAFTGRVN